jgi:Cd2+/Zn2+-exporting ATPase
MQKGETFEMVDPSDVAVGDIIQIKPGEKIPLDGVIISGDTTLDTKALTGESLPQDVIEGDNVLSGTVNLTKTILVKTTKEFGQSTVSKILDLVENASNEKSESEAFISKFAKYYTPIVVILAILLALIPPLFIGFKDNNWLTFHTWIYRALSFLVVSCPCALVISVPMSFFSGLGGASRNGVLIKGSIHLERFNKASVFVFDKTGTLTKGNFAIKKIYNETNEDILKLAYIAEEASNHPIAISIKNRYLESNKVENFGYSLENIVGKGIKATKGKDTILAGNLKLLQMFNVYAKEVTDPGTIVYVAHNGNYIGYILIEDEIKEDAKETVAYLNSIGSRTIMLTGDNEKIASNVAKEIGLSEFKSNLLPQNKVEEVDNLLKDKKENELLCFVGDGINDAPVIMKSDIGISMGGVGSDAAIEASDIVLMHDDLKSIITAKKVARKTMRIVYENIIFALCIKVLILILAAFGVANMWLSVFGDVGVAIIAILNAMRANSKKY